MRPLRCKARVVIPNTVIDRCSPAFMRATHVDRTSGAAASTSTRTLRSKYRSSSLMRLRLAASVVVCGRARASTGHLASQFHPNSAGYTRVRGT